jgi:hypothetical protein
MSQSFQSWLKWAADKFAANLAEARANADVPSMGTPSVADPVGTRDICHHPETVTNMLPDGGSLITCMRCAKHWQSLGPVYPPTDNVVCTHPGIKIERPTYDGPSTYACTNCGKQWDNLPDALDEADQTQPIQMDVLEEHSGIDPIVANLASEMSLRMGETMRQLVEATAGTVMHPLPTQPGTMSASIQYADYATVADLKANTPFIARPFAVGDINQPRPDPELVRQNQKMDAAQMVLRRKMMEEAARAAAASFDMDEQNKTNPVKLDGDRKLKVVS